MKKVAWIITTFIVYGSVAVGFELDRAMYNCLRDLRTQNSFCKDVVIPYAKTLCDKDNNTTACYITALFSSNKLAGKYFDKSCDLGHAYSCDVMGAHYDIDNRTIGSYYNFPQSKQPNLDKAANYYHKSCEIDEYYGEVCYHIIKHFYDGKQDYSKAVELFGKSCDLGKGISCFLFGRLYHYGNGVKQDYAKARELYQKACDLGSGNACEYIGISYEYNTLGIKLGIKQDYQKAREYYQKACELNNASGCYDLGVLYSNGQGVRQNKNVAKDYFGKACDLGSRLLGCYNYRKLNEQGY